MSTDFPVVSKITSFSPVWIVPIITVLIAGWLAFEAWQDTGLTIEIVFDSAAGVAVGKTHVRYRDVDVGKVTKIKLGDNFEQVSVFVELDPHISSMISADTRFWVVSPRITGSGISGLETLLSGAYIGMAPGHLEEKSLRFEGSSEPPVIRSYERGTDYVLVSESLGSLNPGSPVYYRKIPVGEVTGYKYLSGESGHVHIQVFVKHPYDRLVKTNSQFWNISGIDVSIGAEGIETHVGPLASLLIGGVAFMTPPVEDQVDEIAKHGHRFHLLENLKAVKEDAISVSYEYITRFSGSMRGLRVGAPVELRGIQVGQVKHVGWGFQLSDNSKMNVIISIQPERWITNDTPTDVPTQEHLNNIFAQLVTEGLQAQLKTSNLVIGSMYVDLVPHAAKKKKTNKLHQLTDYQGYVELPTADSEFTRLARQLSETVDKIQTIPIGSIGHNFDESLGALRNIIKTLEASNVAENVGEIAVNLKLATKSLDSTVLQLEQTLKSLDQTIAPDSELNHNLNKMISNISDAAKSIEQLTDELNRYPNALLRGKEKNN